MWCLFSNLTLLLSVLSYFQSQLSYFWVIPNHISEFCSDTNAAHAAKGMAFSTNTVFAKKLPSLALKLTLQYNVNI